jgi:glutamate 5-kinase
MAVKKLKKKIWVIKVGSALFVEGGPLLVREWVRQIADLKGKHHIDVVWVTSGAIASARARIDRSWSKLTEKQALSALGQPMLMDAYNLALQAKGLLGAQVLLTYDDIARSTHRKNLKNTLSQLLEWNIVPILNENDAVATEEIQFGDNDLLSAKVANLLDAERLVIMTNVEGLFDKNPEKHKDAKLISHLPKITPKLLKAMDPKAVSAHGRGGMYSKVRAAAHAQKNKIPTWIIRGDVSGVLLTLAKNENVGTLVGEKPVKVTR